MTRADARRRAVEAIAAQAREEGGSPRETADVVSTPATAVPPSSLPDDPCVFVTQNHGDRGKRHRAECPLVLVPTSAPLRQATAKEMRDLQPCGTCGPKPPREVVLPSLMPVDRPQPLRAPNGTHTPRHTFRAPQELWDAFQLKARENGVNGSEVLRMKMEEYVSP